MNISDDKLMAYLDDEHEAAERDALEAALAGDAELTRRVAVQRALRDRLRMAFDRTLDEPVPQRLIEAVDRAPIVDLRPGSSNARRPRTAAVTWLAAAASLVLGMFIGPWLLRIGIGEPRVVVKGTSVIASGELAQALSEQLASQPMPGHPVRMGVSFISHGGEYCRTFVAASREGSMAGLACHARDGWRIPVLEAVAEAPRQDDEYRQAATSLPPLVLQAAETLMAGEPLDGKGEDEARARNWLKPPGIK